MKELRPWGRTEEKCGEVQEVGCVTSFKEYTNTPLKAWFPRTFGKKFENCYKRIVHPAKKIVFSHPHVVICLVEHNYRFWYCLQSKLPTDNSTLRNLIESGWKCLYLICFDLFCTAQLNLVLIVWLSSAPPLLNTELLPALNIAVGGSKRESNHMENPWIGPYISSSQLNSYLNRIFWVYHHLSILEKQKNESSKRNSNSHPK